MSATLRITGSSPTTGALLALALLGGNDPTSTTLETLASRTWANQTWASRTCADDGRG